MQSTSDILLLFGVFIHPDDILSIIIIQSKLLMRSYQDQQTPNNSTLPVTAASSPCADTQTIKKVKSVPRMLDPEGQLLNKSSSCTTLNDAFNISLINRIRSISRRPQESLIKTVGSQNCLSKSTKCRKHFQNIKQRISKERECPADEKQTMIGQAFGQEMKDLQQMLQYQKRRNEQLQSLIQKYECEIFIFKQQIEQLTEQIQEKDVLLKERERKSCKREQEHWMEYQTLYENHQNMLLKYNEVCEDLQERKQAMEQRVTQRVPCLKMVQVVKERVISVPSLDKMALLKANSDLVSLKNQQELAMSQLRRQWQGQLHEIRQKFIRNLNHYKEIIIKFSSKNTQGKTRESLLESSLTENSTIDEI